VTRDRAQAALLTRTFFSRLFESELMPTGVPQVRLVVSVISGIAVLLTMVPALLRLHPSRLVAFQYTISMIAFAFLALVLWEGIFPDRRDGRVLSVLPIRTRTFVVARLGALGLLFGIFAAGSAAMPSFIFMALGNPFAHFIGLIGTNAFSFFAVVALQCVVLNVSGRATAQRLAIVLQVAIVIVALQTPMMPVSPKRAADYAAATAWGLPSLWFTGLFEVLSGNATAATLSLAAASLAGAVGLPLATILLYAMTYRRLVRRAIEGEPPGAGPRSMPAMIRAAADRLDVFAVPSPVARAVCLFTLRTVARSRRHRMLLAMYVGVGVALVLSVVGERIVARGLAGFSRPDASLLSLPLVMLFMTLVGIRALIRIPVEITANWVFRLREPADRAGAIRGVASAMTLGVVAPIVAAAAVMAWALWGPLVALKHALFCTVMGLLLVNALLLRFHKFPCTCTYHPGSSRMRVLWPFYLTAFTMYSLTMSRIEARLLGDPRGFAILLAVLAFVAVAFAVVRRLLLREFTGFRFEEKDPDAIFEGFRLSEILAAERARRSP
jgi:hypothetical protein